MEKKQTLTGLRAMKVICVFLLFWWHSPLMKPPFDIGARACEFYFVVSGFLVAYQHADKNKDAKWKDSFSYLKEKICKMWPLHCFCFLLVLLNDGVFGDFLERSVTALFNIFLLHAWINDANVFFSFNGVSWFLSAILFCYFLSPLLLKGLKTKRSVIVSFTVIASLRLFAEFLQIKGYNVFVPFSMHTFPVIRAMEFYCGMTLYRFREYLNNFLIRHKKENNILLYSISEFLMLFLTIWLVVTQNNSWMRGHYVLLFCCLVFVFSFNKGVVSIITNDLAFKRNPLAKVLAMLSCYEFEIFMLHQVMLEYSSVLLLRYFSVVNIWLISLVALIMTLAIAWMWKRKISPVTTKWMRQMFKKAGNWLGYGP